MRSTGCFVLPESLPPDGARRSLDARQSARRAPPAALQRGARRVVRRQFIAQLAHVVLPSSFVLYTTYRYGWDSKTVGLTLAMVGVCAMVVQGLAIGPIVRVLGERNALLLGLCCGAVGFVIFGAAPTGPLFWLGIPVMSLWGISGAAMQSLMTRLVAPDQQGQLQGATASVQSVSQLVGPFLFTLTFSYFIGASAPWQLPGAPFLLAAVLMVVCAWRSRCGRWVRRRRSRRVGKAKRAHRHFAAERRWATALAAPLPTLRQRPYDCLTSSPADTRCP